MQKKCFIDKNIRLTKSEFESLKLMNLTPMIFDDQSTNPEEIDYLLLHSKLADKKLMAMPNCKYIGILAHNTDYVNAQIAKKLSIVVRGLQNQHGIHAVAEHVFSLILSLSKNLTQSHDNVVNGKWKQDLPLNFQLNGKQLGIVGYGQIGKKVAQLGQAFGMHILIYDHKNKGLDMADVFKSCDVISLHLSSKADNDQIINGELLALMKQGSILINTARGSILDYDALDKELSNNKFLGVGLDVFDCEPLLNSKLTNYPNVVLTPHIAYMTDETLANMNTELLDNLKTFLS